MIRHRDVSRLEGFSDAVFGFALTLLVVSLETPRSMADLRLMAGGFFPFVLMFAMVTWIWYQHNQFFRRYDLQDAWTIFLNSVLLFVVLFYVYPLKFLTLALVGPLTMPQEALPNIQDVDGPMLMTLYSTGVLLIFLIFGLLHLHARSRRTQLGLGDFELLELKYALRGNIISAGLAVASLALVAIMPHDTRWAGLIYTLMGPLHGWNGYAGGTAKAKFLEPPEPSAPST